MTDRDNGGAAFPGPSFTKGGHPSGHDMGMTLRDWFASNAPLPSQDWLHMMRGIDRGRNPHNDPHKPAPRDDFQLTAEFKYAHADAMLAARNK